MKSVLKIVLIVFYVFIALNPVFAGTEDDVDPNSEPEIETEKGIKYFPLPKGNDEEAETPSEDKNNQDD